jgi:hypothetical protein
MDMIVVDMDGVRTYFSPALWNTMKARHPKATYHFASPNVPLLLKEGGKVVGGIMPIKLEKGSPIATGDVLTLGSKFGEPIPEKLLGDAEEGGTTEGAMRPGDRVMDINPNYAKRSELWNDDGAPTQDVDLVVIHELRRLGFNATEDGSAASYRTRYYKLEHDELLDEDGELQPIRLRVSDHPPNYNREWDVSVSVGNFTPMKAIEHIASKVEAKYTPSDKIVDLLFTDFDSLGGGKWLELRPDNLEGMRPRDLDRSLAESSRPSQADLDPEIAKAASETWRSLDGQRAAMRRIIDAADAETVSRGAQAIRDAVKDLDASPKAKKALLGILDRRPDLFEDVGVILTSDADAPLGAYNPGKSLVMLSKAFDAPDPKTAMEEIIHSVERFLTVDQRAIVYNEYAKEVSKEIRKLSAMRETAKAAKDTATVKELTAKIEWLRKAGKGYVTKDVPSEYYHLSDASEFWATKVMELEMGRADVSNLDRGMLRSALARTKELLRELWRAVKEKFGYGDKDLEAVWKNAKTGGEVRNLLNFDTRVDMETFFDRDVMEDDGAFNAAMRPQNKPLPVEVDKALKRAGGLREEKPLGVRVREGYNKIVDNAVERAIQGMFDFAYSVKKHSAEAWQSIHRARNAGQVFGHALTNGGLKFNRSTGLPEIDNRHNSLMEILKPAAQDGMVNHVVAYMGARRAEEELDRAAVDPKSKVRNPSPFTPAELKEMLALGKEKVAGGKTVADVADAAFEWNRQFLDFAVETGLIDATVRKEFERASYVPFFREIEIKLANGEDYLDVLEPATKGEIVGQDSGIKRFTGSDKKLSDLLENMMGMSYHLVNAGMKNVAATKTIDALTQAGVAQPVAANAVPRTKLKRDEAGFVSIMRNGKREWFQVTDPLVFNAVTFAGHDYGKFMNAFIKVASLPRRILTKGVTVSPDFMGPNIARDTVNAWAVTGEKMIPFWDTLKAMGKEVNAFLPEFIPFMGREAKPTDVRGKMQASGSGGGGYYGASGFLEGSAGGSGARFAKGFKKDLERSVRSDASKAVNLANPINWFRFMERLGEASENASRIAVYNAVKKRGGSEQEALWEAQNLINYNMQGQWAMMGLLGQLFPFFNARMAGLYRLGQAGSKATGAAKELVTTGKITDKQGKAMLNRALTMTALSAALAVWNWNENAEEYDAIEDWDRDSNWQFFVPNEDGTKTRYRMPKPFELGLMFGTAPERLVGAIHGNSTDKGDGKLLWDRFSHAMFETLNMPTYSEIQLIKPLEEVARNESFFTGRPIITPAQQGLEPEQQFSAATTRTARGISEAMPDFAPEALRSPKKLETLVRGYLGTLGSYALMSGDLMNDMQRSVTGMDVLPGAYGPTRKTRDLPVIRRFFEGVQDDTDYTRYMSKFYENLAASSMAAKTLQEVQRSGDMAKAKRIAEKYRLELLTQDFYLKAMGEIGDLNKVSRQINESKVLTPDEKREKLDRITQMKNRIARQTLKLAEKMEGSMSERAKGVK